MFIDNKYKKWYDKIIERAGQRISDGYTEKHHIIPKSLGGTDDYVNIAILTAKEHYICHRLLILCSENTYVKIKMQHAFGRFLQLSPTQDRKITAAQYDIIRKEVSKARTGRKHSRESRRKMSESHKGKVPWNKGRPGPEQSKETRQKRAKSLTGIKRSEETKQKISQGKIGHTAGMTGKRHSEETKQKMSKNMKGPRGPQQRKQCANCGQNDMTSRHIKYCKDRYDNNA